MFFLSAENGTKMVNQEREMSKVMGTEEERVGYRVRVWVKKRRHRMKVTEREREECRKRRNDRRK